MSNIAYLRVSTADQNTDRQLDGLAFDKTFTDKCSGGSTNRPALKQLIEFVREGDTVNVHSIDRLARNSQDLLRLVSDFKAAGVSVIFHKENLTFASGSNDAMGNLMFTMIGAFSEFEHSMILERQREGIAKAKGRGVYTGSKASISRDSIAELLEQGVSPTQVGRELGISRASVYRIKAEIA